MGEEDLLLFVLAGPQLLKTVGTAPVIENDDLLELEIRRCNQKTRGIKNILA